MEKKGDGAALYVTFKAKKLIYSFSSKKNSKKEAVTPLMVEVGVLQDNVFSQFVRFHLISSLYVPSPLFAFLSSTTDTHSTDHQHHSS